MILNSAIYRLFVQHQRKFLLIISLCLGALMPLGFAPFNAYGILPLVIAIWLYCLEYTIKQPKFSFWYGFTFGVGYFVCGIWWIVISLYQFGNAPLSVAIIGMLGVVSLMASYYGIFAYLYARCLYLPLALRIGCVSPLLWVLMEYTRAYLFTGFPWLALGYALVDSPFASMLLPKMGALFASIWIVIVASLITLVMHNYTLTRRASQDQSPLNYHSYQPLIGLMMILVISLFLLRHVGSRIEPFSTPLKMSAIQANTPQMLKFDQQYYQQVLHQHITLTGDVLEQSDVIIWPETAIPSLYEQEQALYERLRNWARYAHNSIFVGTFRSTQKGHIYNTIAQLHEGEDQFYDKAHLLPFGEYIPLRQLISPIQKLLDIPMSDLSAGASQQQPFKVNDIALAASICFETSFGNALRYQAKNAQILMNISNDAWFGNTNAPWQHFQIVRARAIEFARPIMRATSTGISAGIDHHGVVIATAPLFTSAVINANIQGMVGNTPYVVIGDHPWGGLVIFLLCCILLQGYYLSKAKKSCHEKKSKKN